MPGLMPAGCVGFNNIVFHTARGHPFRVYDVQWLADDRIQLSGFWECFCENIPPESDLAPDDPENMVTTVYQPDDQIMVWRDIEVRVHNEKRQNRDPKKEVSRE